MNDKTVAVRTFSLLLITLAAYFLLWQTLTLYFTLPVYYYGRLIELLAILLFAALACCTPMRFEQMGIVVPKGLLLRSLCAGSGVALLFILALALAGSLVGNTPFFSLSINGDISRVTYVLVAPLQEILSKSVMYYSFERCLDGKHPHLTNLLCALTFAVFHVVYGLRMMLLAMTLSLLTGWLFRKFRCVWGCAVVHFSLGFFPLCFGF